mgnify:FL=1
MDGFNYRCIECGHSHQRKIKTCGHCGRTSFVPVPTDTQFKKEVEEELSAVKSSPVLFIKRLVINQLSKPRIVSSSVQLVAN